jgi:hypothetical protein
MVNSAPDILDQLKTLILPKMTTAVRDTLVAEVGMIIYNTTTSKINFCKTKAAGAGSWEAVTSV